MKWHAKSRTRRYHERSTWRRCRWWRRPILAHRAETRSKPWGPRRHAGSNGPYRRRPPAAAAAETRWLPSVLQHTYNSAWLLLLRHTGTSCGVLRHPGCLSNVAERGEVTGATRLSDSPLGPVSASGGDDRPSAENRVQ